MSRHKHADLMIAFANDTSLVIEVNGGDGWTETTQPLWRTDLHYRIKPAPKKVCVFMYESKSTDKLCHVTCDSIDEAERIRSDLVRLGCEVTTIKEVVVE